MKPPKVTFEKNGKKITQTDLGMIYTMGHSFWDHYLCPYNLEGLDFRGMDLNRFIFMSTSKAEQNDTVLYWEYVFPENMDKAIFHDDPEANSAIVKMIIDKEVNKRSNEFDFHIKNGTL